ncbi:MAG TPA: phage tail protein [Solirubrobacteraceae bacterium]|nr:phage tail protein [Solirubrobacteraceae bacterium]
MPTGVRQDPYRSHNFLVEIDGITRAGFRECSGLETRQAPIEYREGSDPLTVSKLPGLVTYANITLRWGITNDPSFWEWRQNAMDGDVQRLNGSIVLLDETGAEQLRWNFRQAWPSAWVGPTFNATANEVAIESVEIAHEGVLRAP